MKKEKKKERKEKDERKTNLSRRGRVSLPGGCIRCISGRRDTRHYFQQFYLATRPPHSEMFESMLASCLHFPVTGARAPPLCRLSLSNPAGDFRCNCDICAPLWDFIREHRAQGTGKVKLVRPLRNRSKGWADCSKSNIRFFPRLSSAPTFCQLVRNRRFYFTRCCGKALEEIPSLPLFSPRVYSFNEYTVSEQFDVF